MAALTSSLVQIWLLALLTVFGCAHNSPVTAGRELASRGNLRPIDLAPDITENMGREALQKIGYEEIIRLAEEAGFVAYKSDVTIQLVSYGSPVSTDFIPVFSRYAVAAAVASQADSPLPGPADLAAVGVVVLGLVDAGLLDGYLLDTVGAWLVGTRGKLLMSKAQTNEAKGTGDATAAAGEAATHAADLVGKSTVGAAIAKVLQTGGNRIDESTARGLDEASGMNLPRREWGRALERLKKGNDLPNNHHGRILSTGDYLNDAGKCVGNLLDYL